MRLLLVLLLPCTVFCQKIDHFVSFRDIKSESYSRFHYDNDYFTSTDRNYTQGYNFELVLKAFRKNPLNHIFFKSKDSEFRYGVSLEHIGYTPDKYKFAEIQYGDRPFAAAIMLKNFLIATDTIRKSRLTSSLNLGILGPGAFGKEMQVGIHEATGNTIPLGWRNQIKNDVVINYQVDYEKQLFRFRNIFAINAQGTARLGTLFTNASVGINSVIGIINSPFTSVTAKRKFSLYAYSQPMVSVIGYDATLQGGLFNDKSPYTIPSGHIKRFVGQHNYGIILQTRTLYFEYSRTMITREFYPQASGKWGGIRFGFTF
ncbi:lipid A deacylase LpxR family protein [Flavobacterium silvaticum]|uniref:Lipid A deacylase LpxR family protein n=1 Tax=Flavobacterium silvaticum TaxID=1852020 RepID=A0A972FJD5_9FLAO|nr:lipid A deacylase LpxR family protein [Flavobacterium silvaticum]NMH26853.1 lipid A deacylase LpxR family protein [Flavobacterium silvaticum]